MANAPEGHLVYKGFEAWIVMDGQPLPQFGAEYKEAAREGTAWIPSTAGKPFSVCYRKLPGDDNHDYTADVYLDGHFVSGRLYERDQPSYLAVDTISSVELSPTEIRDFMFNPIELTDDDAFLTNFATQVGDIKVVLRFAQTTDEAPSPHVYKPCAETEKIHERAKKGVAHRIKFSESKTRPPTDLLALTSTPVGRPVTFIFKYRPLDTLQANGIAPRPTPPAEADASDADDVDEIAVREKALLAELAEVRRQKRARDDIERPVKRAKTEPVDPLLFGGVIDLTEEREEEQKLVKREVIDLP